MMSPELLVSDAVHHLVVLVNLLPAAFFGGGRRLVTLPLFERKLAPQMTEVREPLGIELTSFDRGEHRTARFGFMRAIAEAAAAGELRDVLEGFGNRRLVHPRLQLAHSRRVDEECAAWQLDQVTRGRRMPSFAVNITNFS